MSPDGTRIAAEIYGEDGNTDLWIWRLDQGPLTRLTFDVAADYSPLWTPDGERVVFSSQRDGGGLFWKVADGTGEVERLLESPVGMRTWDWSADGRLIFGRSPGDIGVLDVEGERRVEMLFESEFYESEPALSPDGRWLAYAPDESGQQEIYVQPFPNIDDGKWQVSTSGGVLPLWSPDGRRLYYVTRGAQNRMMVAEVVTDPTLAPGTPTEVFDIAYRYGPGGTHDLAADGQRSLVLVPGGTSAGGEEASLVVVQNWHQELLERVPIP